MTRAGNEISLDLPTNSFVSAVSTEECGSAVHDLETTPAFDIRFRNGSSRGTRVVKRHGTSIAFDLVERSNLEMALVGDHAGKKAPVSCQSMFRSCRTPSRAAP